MNYYYFSNVSEKCNVNDFSSKKIIKEAMRFSRLSLADNARAAPAIPKPVSNGKISL